MFYDLYKDAVTFTKTDGSKESTDVLGGSGEGGISEDSANLLCDILEEALYGSVQTEAIELLRRKLTNAPEPIVLESISAVYDGGEVEVGTELSVLTDITVTAHYSDGSSNTVTGYTLSGTIAEGNNTIMISYNGKSATITVVGKAEAQPEPSGSKNLANPSLMLEGKNIVKETNNSTEYTISDSSANVIVVFKAIKGHKYKGLTRNGNSVMTGNTFFSSNIKEITTDTTFPIGASSGNATNTYIFGTQADRYFEYTSDDEYAVIIVNRKTYSIPVEDIMIYDLTENGVISTFEEYRE